MTNEEREYEELKAFQEIMFTNWTRRELSELDKIAQATNAYDNFMKRKGQQQ